MNCKPPSRSTRAHPSPCCRELPCLSQQWFRKEPHWHVGPTACAAKHEELAIEIVKLGKAGVEFICRNLDPNDGCRYVAAIRSLGWVSNESPCITRVKRLVLDALNRDRAIVNCAALHTLRHLRVRIGLSRARRLFLANNAFVSVAALMYVSAMYPDARGKLLRSALKSSRFLVREAAADEIGEQGLVGFLPELRSLRTDRFPDVREAARTAMRCLTRTTGSEC